MQMLSELLRRAVEKGVLTSEELYLTEADVIARLTGDGELCRALDRSASFLV